MRLWKVILLLNLALGPGRRARLSPVGPGSPGLREELARLRTEAARPAPSSWSAQRHRAARDPEARTRSSSRTRRSRV